MKIYEYNIYIENKAEKGKSNKIFVQVNTQIFMMCPLSVLILSNFLWRKIGMTSPQISYFLVWILGGSNSTGSRIIPYYGRKISE